MQLFECYFRRKGPYSARRAQLIFWTENESKTQNRKLAKDFSNVILFLCKLIFWLSFARQWFLLIVTLYVYAIYVAISFPRARLNRGSRNEYSVLISLYPLLSPALTVMISYI